MTNDAASTTATHDRREGAEAREAVYWDRQASGISEEDLSSCAEPTDRVSRCFVEQLGDLRGKRVLDVGCGTGQWAVYFAKAGAEVWAIDISPESVAVATRRAGRHVVSDRVHASVASATATGFSTGHFDLVCGQDIVHHLEADVFGREVSRVLRQGGRAVFNENCANNPLLMFARNHICGRFGIARWSSEDEYPLTRSRLRQFASAFEACQVRYPDFLFFFYFNAKVFGYRSRLVSALCSGADTFVYRWLPFLRRYSYRQVVTLTGPRQVNTRSVHAT